MKSAVETMGSIYNGEQIELPQEVAQWQNFMNVTASGLLENISFEAGQISSELEGKLSDILVQTGGNLLNNLPEMLAGLLPRLKEKLAARELRLRFGDEPLSLLAVPVFMELSQMDVHAHMELQDSQQGIESVVERLKREVASAIQLFIMEQIERIEKELNQHEVALASSTKISHETAGGLDQQLGKFEPKFAEKRRQLSEEKNSLYGLLAMMTNSFDQLSQQSHAPIINMIEQDVGGPALMAA